MRTSTTSICLLAVSLASTASAQLVVGYSSGESYSESFRTGLVEPLAPFAAFEVYAAAADEAQDVLYVFSDGVDPIASSLWRWEFGSTAPPVEVATVQHPAGVASRWDGLAFDGTTLYAVLQFAPFSAPPTARGLYTIDPATAVTAQVMSFSGRSIGALAYYAADGMLYAPDDVAGEIVRIDVAAQSVTSVPGSAYPPGVVDLDGCTIGGDRLYLVDDDANAAVLVFNLTTGAYEASAGISSTVAAGTCGAAWAPDVVDVLGTRYCTPAVANSTGAPARLTVRGNASAAANDVDLRATSLPSGSFGFFLTSRMQGMVANPGGSQGTLCLGGSIGRYVGPGQIQNSGAAGEMSLVLDLTQTPTPTGFVTLMANETWFFQGWYRDLVAGNATSNLTDGVLITLQ